MPETTLAETAAKQAAYAQLAEQIVAGIPRRLAADLYTAAFFLPKTSDITRHGAHHRAPAQAARRPAH